MLLDTFEPQPQVGAPGLCEEDGLGPPRRSFHVIFGCCLWHPVCNIHRSQARTRTPRLYVIAYESIINRLVIDN